MVKLFGFLRFCGNSFCGIAKQLFPILTKASPCSLLFMHNSVKNSYLGTSLMASKIGLFISTFLKVGMALGFVVGMVLGNLVGMVIGNVVGMALGNFPNSYS